MYRAWGAAVGRASESLALQGFAAIGAIRAGGRAVSSQPVLRDLSFSRLPTSNHVEQCDRNGARTRETW
jgi:hypothetical protein